MIYLMVNDKQIMLDFFAVFKVLDAIRVQANISSSVLIFITFDKVHMQVTPANVSQDEVTFVKHISYSSSIK